MKKRLLTILSLTLILITVLAAAVLADEPIPYRVKLNLSKYSDNLYQLDYIVYGKPGANATNLVNSAVATVRSDLLEFVSESGEQVDLKTGQRNLVSEFYKNESLGTTAIVPDGNKYILYFEPQVKKSKYSNDGTTFATLYFKLKENKPISGEEKIPVVKAATYAEAVKYGATYVMFISDSANLMLIVTDNKATKGVYNTDKYDLKEIKEISDLFAVEITNTPSVGKYTISGNVTTSTGDGEATIELKQSKSVVGTAAVSGGSYTIADVEPGKYTLVVSKSKHAPREYEVVVSENNVTQDVEIWLYGDVNHDGMVDSSDATQILRYDAGLPSIFDIVDSKDYRQIVAHITVFNTQQGTLGSSDATQILRYDAGLSSIFNIIP